MMITIQGLAPKTKYTDVKLLIKQECNIDDFILDNLVPDVDGTKKVRIGLANESEGFKLIKCLNGYHMPGNYVVKVSPIGKHALSEQPGVYDARSSYQNQPRNDYQINPPRSDYTNQSNSNDYNRSPHESNVPRGAGTGQHGPSGQRGQHGPTGQHRPGGPSKPYGSSGSHPQAPPDNRHSQWLSNNKTPNPWGPNQSITSQAPQNSFNIGSGLQQNTSSGYIQQHQNPRTEIRVFDQGRQGPTPEQNYGGYAPKSNVPVTIMKDNFQGPTPFNINHPAVNQPQYQQRGATGHWNPHSQQDQLKPQVTKAFEERKYPPLDLPRDAKNLQSRPDTYKDYEKRRGYSPTPRDPMPRKNSPVRRDELHREPAGRMSDRGPRRLSPNRKDFTQRRISPPGRRDDPIGRRYSPSGKKISPEDNRRNIPSHPGPRHESPHKRISPNRRLVSPGRRDERPISRYSPSRHYSDKVGEKFGQAVKDLKKVRPAYEPTATQAPNQASSMYSGGFRSSDHDNVQYPIPGMRQEQSDSWHRQIDEQTIPMKQRDVERRQMARERVPEQIEKRYSPSRKSRSPVRRDRSPIRDRFKRNSLSPRSSYSPRRSWALEKRRSPDAPPPPIWPVQNPDREHGRSIRPNFAEKDEKPKHQPIWEGRSLKEEELRSRHPEDRRSYEEAKIRVAKELMERESSAHAGSNDRYQQKFPPREDYGERRDIYRRRDLPERKPLADYRDLPRRPREEDRFDDYNRRRESPHREIKNDTPKDFDKDFEDIYNRAVQFKKKTEELRKSGSRKRDDFDDNRRRDEKIDHPRQHYDDHGRYREEESLRQREREDRLPRDDRRLDDRFDDDRTRRESDRRDDYRSSDNQQNEKSRQIETSNNSNSQKREKAIEEIAQKILEKNEEYKNVQGDQRRYILEELKQIVTKIVYEMFGDSEVSFIEVIIKYQARYNLKDEAKILQDAIRSLPKQFRTIKRHAPESDNIPVKTSRNSPSSDLNQEPAVRPKLSDSNINVKLPPPAVLNMTHTGVPPPPTVMGQTMMPVMVSPPFYQSYDNLQHNLQNSVYIPAPVQPDVDVPQSVAPIPDFAPPLFTEEDKKGGYKLYLRRDDFERISHMEADFLKEYLISQMFQGTGEYQGWSPDFTFKGLQGFYRYEVVTKDEWSKNWLLNLDFTEFKHFHVLVYTEEELWYERVAIWLPGHSRVRNIEPFEKLKLQNTKIYGVNINKWKFVKKIVNGKGTRLYVDMPPSSARALETHGMKLSYELQQVNVFAKAIAVDKDSFDAGLKDFSTADPQVIENAIKNSPMPVLANDVSLIKITLNGCKKLSLPLARKIKEVVIYNLFQYHKINGNSRTDFVKYGFLPPNYFAILPLNQESKRWLLGCNFPKVEGQFVTIEGAEESITRYITMNVTVPYERHLRSRHLLEKLKNSNQGVKNINFSLWRSTKMNPVDMNNIMYKVEVDMESLETLAAMQYQLDYVDTTGLHTVCFESKYSQSEIEDLIKNHKAEMMDSYDVANMDLDSNASECSGNDVICLD
ncbi:unnamed protein product [Arctia plantaginis]|uniref:DUF4780 domain-containing protein n=1 Tax=Arctia plantaginis TaxID=874455 RepID=A0A8S1AJU0_ARCPL|nr:unnamed protein product [Arctia plantaginis]